MGKRKSCKEKQSFFSEEHAVACGLPGLVVYECPSCGNFHTTSQKKNVKNRERGNRYR